MRSGRLKFMIAALLAAIGFSPAILEAGCGQCVPSMFGNYENCLLGCPITNPNCDPYYCQDGSATQLCGIGTSCSIGLNQPLLASGTVLALSAANLADPLAAPVQVPEAEGHSVSRIPCNAVVVAHLYSDLTSAEVLASAAAIRL